MAIGQQNIVDMGGEGDGDGKSTPKPKPSAAKPTVSEDRDLRGRITSILNRIAEAAEARGDEELAEVLREDTAVMATGLVSLTRPFRALRGPIVLLLGIVEPVMAFSRFGRLMVYRMMDRRAEKVAEREQPPVT